MRIVDEIRLDKMAAQVVTELHGKYNEQAYRGNVFTATMTGGVILPAPTSTASNPIALANPAGSGKNVSLIRFEMVLTAAIGTPVIGTYGLFVKTNVVAATVSGTALVVAGVIVRCETTIGGVTVGSLIPRCAFAESGMMVRYGVTMGAVTVGDGFTEEYGGTYLRRLKRGAYARAGNV